MNKILTLNGLPRTQKESVAPSPGYSEDSRVNWLSSEHLARRQAMEKDCKGTHCWNVSSMQICKHTFLEKLAVPIKITLGQVCVSRLALVQLVAWADTDFGSRDNAWVGMINEWCLYSSMGVHLTSWVSFNISHNNSSLFKNKPLYSDQ